MDYGIAMEVRDLIPETSLAEPPWGAPQIHGKLLKLCIDVAQSTFASYTAKGRWRIPNKNYVRLRNRGIGCRRVEVVRPCTRANSSPRSRPDTIAG